MTSTATIAHACKVMHGKGFRIAHLAIVSALANREDGLHTPQLSEITGQPNTTVNNALRELEGYGLVSLIQAGRGGTKNKGNHAWLTAKGAALAHQLTGGHAIN